MTLPRSLAIASLAMIAAAFWLLPGGEERILLVSGRDDHGLLRESKVPLVRHWSSGVAAGWIADGHLVEVVSTYRDWVRVKPAGGKGPTGWLHGFYLRRTVHLIASAPGCHIHRESGGAFAANQQVEIVEVDRSATGAEWVRVRPAEGGLDGWVPRSAISELPRRCDASTPAHGH